VREDEHPPAPTLDGVTADGGHHRGLPTRRRDDDARVVITTSQVVVHGIDGLDLVWAELHHQVITAVSVAAASQ